MKQKNKPAISVLMSAYNSEKYIAEAIESILNQTFGDFEFIIINDGSTDKTLKIMQKYAKKDKRIKLIDNFENIGQTKSRNKALKIAKGKYVAIMDSDDISLPTRLKIEYDYLERNMDIFLVGSSIRVIDENGEYIKKKTSITGTSKIEKTMIDKNCIFHPSIMFRNEHKDFYREKFIFSEDYDFYLNLLSRGKRLENCKEFLLFYRRSLKAIGISKKEQEALFAKKAREFYNERKNGRYDGYRQFNPRDILMIKTRGDLPKSMSYHKVVSFFNTGNYRNVQIYSKKYIKRYGPLNKITIYYLITTFLSPRAISILRRIT